MLPNNIILMQGETINFNTILGINIKNAETMQASTSLNNSIAEETGKTNFKLNIESRYGIGYIMKTEVYIE